MAVRIVESQGASARGWEAAVLDAVKAAKADAPDPLGVEVVRLWADLAEGPGIRRYRASVKVAYRVALARP